MASLQSNSTSSFKHHLRGMLGMVFVYIVRTSTIAKNRHLNIVLQAELYLRTGTCTGYVVIRLDPPSPEKTPSPGDQRLFTYSFDR